MSNLNWANELNPSDLPSSITKIANLIGVRSTMILCQNFGGVTFYFPKTDAVIRPIRDKRIRQEFNGYNYKDLAIKYNLTEMWVRIILADHPKETGQTELFAPEKEATKVL